MLAGVNSQRRVVAVMVVANVRVATDLMSLLPNILWLSTTTSGLLSQQLMRIIKFIVLRLLTGLREG